MADRASIVQLLLNRLNTLHNMLKCVVYDKQGSKQYFLALGSHIIFSQ